MLVLTFVLVVATSSYIYGLLTTEKVTPTEGAIANVDIEVYADSGCTQLLPTISWGFLYPGENTTYTVYVKHQGNINAALIFDTANWNPYDASDSMTLTWDYSGQPLEPSVVLPVTFTLDVASAIENVAYFTFDIVITSYG